MVDIQYSPIILENILCLVLQIFLDLAVFECNTTFDWLNHIWFSQSEVVLHSNLQDVLENGWRILKFYISVGVEYLGRSKT